MDRPTGTYFLYSREDSPPPRLSFFQIIFCSTTGKVQISPTFFSLLWPEKLFIGHIKQMTVFPKNCNTTPTQKGKKIIKKKKKNPTSRLAFFFSTRWTGNAFLLKDRVGRSGHDPLRAYLTNDISLNICNR